MNPKGLPVNASPGKTPIKTKGTAHTIISWTRLLAGGFRDPLVGRDVLVGAVWGAGLGFVFPLASLVPEWLGHGAGAPWIKSLDAFLGPSRALAQLVRFPLNAIGVAVAALLTLLLLKLLLRRERAAALALAVLLTVFQTFEIRANSDAPLYVNIALALAIMGTFTLLLLRGGLLSAVTGVTVGNCLLVFHLTTDFGGWRGGPTVLTLLLVGALVALAFRASQQAAGGGTARAVRSGA